MAAGASLPFYNEAALAQDLRAIGTIPADAVKINANENPMGPCPAAIEAIRAVAPQGGRYLFDHTFAFIDAMAETEGLPSSHVLPFAGSSDPLHRAVLAFASPSRPLVTADPGYEAPQGAQPGSSGRRSSRFRSARIIRTTLKAWSRPIPAPGVIYICNPNNPTGSVTRKEDIEYIVANKPKDCLVLIDEAYIHFSTTAAPAIDLVASDKDVVVLRTFSKLYGMAGLRRAAPWLSGPSGQAQGVWWARHHARDGDGRGHRQFEGEGTCLRASQDSCRDPRGPLRLDAQERLCLHPVRSQYDHG